jgi:hypothetical protein
MKGQLLAGFDEALEDQSICRKEFWSTGIKKRIIKKKKKRKKIPNCSP